MGSRKKGLGDQGNGVGLSDSWWASWLCGEVEWVFELEHVAEQCNRRSGSDAQGDAALHKAHV